MRKWGSSRSVLHRVKFYAEWNNVLLTKLLKRRYIFQLTSMNITLVKILILRTRICLPLVLRNNYSLNAPNLDAYNFGLTRATCAGPKIMEYFSIWLIYILIWCNLCILWINGNNLKTTHSKMVFWGSLHKTLTYSCFRLNG